MPGRAEHADPFAVLGPHDDGAGGQVVNAFLPGALNVHSAREDGRLTEMAQGSLPGLFTAHLDTHSHLLQIGWAGGEQVTEDPYSFGPQLGDMDLHLFAEGNHRDLSGRFGAQPVQVEGVDGCARCGPQRPAGIGGGRLQQLGWASPPDAPAPWCRGVGAVHPRLGVGET